MLQTVFISMHTEHVHTHPVCGHRSFFFLVRDLNATCERLFQMYAAFTRPVSVVVKINTCEGREFCGGVFKGNQNQ